MPSAAEIEDAVDPGSSGRTIKIGPGDQIGWWTVIREVAVPKTELSGRTVNRRHVDVVCLCGREHRYSLYRLLQKRGNVFAPRCYKCASAAKRLLVVPGDQFGRWTVVEETDPYVNRNGAATRRFLVQCECWNLAKVPLGNLRGGYSTQCVACGGRYPAQRGCHMAPS